MSTKKKTELAENAAPEEKLAAEKAEADAKYLDEFPMTADDLCYLRKNVLA